MGGWGGGGTSFRGKTLLSELASRSWQTPRKAWVFVVADVSMPISGLHPRAAEIESRNLDLGDQAR